MAVPMGSVAKCKRRLISFCVAGLALCGIATCVIHPNMFHNMSRVDLCNRRNTSSRFSEDDLHFSWQSQHFGGVHHHFEWQAQHFKRVVLRVFWQAWESCCVAGAVFGALCDCSCRFPHWHDCARCHVAFMFRTSIYVWQAQYLML